MRDFAAGEHLDTSASSSPAAGTVRLYWANASTNTDWQTGWTEITPANAASTYVNNLEPGGEWVVNAQWTSIPPPSQSLNGHFCLLARFEANGTADPINGETFGPSIWYNVFNSNNIAWRNVTIVDDDPLNDPHRHSSGGQFYVRNTTQVTTPTRLRFDLRQSGKMYLASADIEIDLGSDLFSKWRESHAAGMGIKVTGPTTVMLTQPHAYLDIALSPREEDIVAVNFRHHPGAAPHHAAKLDVKQALANRAESDNRATKGGVTFEATRLASAQNSRSSLSIPLAELGR